MAIATTIPNSIPSAKTPPAIGLTMSITHLIFNSFFLVNVLFMGVSVKQAFLVAMLTFVEHSLSNDKTLPTWGILR